MRRTILIWGLLAGLFMVGLQWIIYPLCYRGYISPDNSYLGYAGMIICFSIIFFGIKSYRDNQGGGSITFWKGVQIGLMITLIASVIQAAGWYVYNIVNPDFKHFFVQKYTEVKLNSLSDPTDKEATAAIHQEVEMLRTVYGNPLLEFAVTTIVLLPVGLIVTLICAALLRKKELLPAAENEH